VRLCVVSWAGVIPLGSVVFGVGGEGPDGELAGLYASHMWEKLCKPDDVLRVGRNM